MIKENTVHAVLSLMFGKLINGQMHTLHILAKFQEIIGVKVRNVEMEHKGRMEYVIRMDVI